MHCSRVHRIMQPSAAVSPSGQRLADQLQLFGTCSLYTTCLLCDQYLYPYAHYAITAWKIHWTWHLASETFRLWEDEKCHPGSMHTSSIVLSEYIR